MKRNKQKREKEYVVKVEDKDKVMKKKPITLSKRFRRKVYLELAYFYAKASTFKNHRDAAEYLNKNGLMEFLCVNLEYRCPFAPIDEIGNQTEVKPKDFKEFQLFEPSDSDFNKFNVSDVIGGGWWTIHSEGFRERAEVLYLCAEMCK